MLRMLCKKTLIKYKLPIKRFVIDIWNRYMSFHFCCLVMRSHVLLDYLNEFPIESFFDL